MRAATSGFLRLFFLPPFFFAFFAPFLAALLRWAFVSRAADFFLAFFAFFLPPLVLDFLALAFFAFFFGSFLPPLNARQAALSEPYFLMYAFGSLPPRFFALRFLLLLPDFRCLLIWEFLFREKPLRGSARPDEAHCGAVTTPETVVDLCEPL